MSADERIVALEARLAGLEARLAALEARTPIVTYVQAPPSVPLGQRSFFAPDGIPTQPPITGTPPPSQNTCGS